MHRHAMSRPPAGKENPNVAEGCSVRLLLCAALALLFLWLGCAPTASGPPCEASPVTAVSLLLSPLFLYSWLTSSLARLLLAAPAAVLTAVHHSLLLLLAGPWAALCLCAALALTCLQVLVYLLHLVLALGAAAAAAALVVCAPRRDETAAGETKWRPARRPEEGNAVGAAGPMSGSAAI